MTNGLNFKELYSVSLKSTYPIEVNGETIEAGETIALFDKIQIANFQEIKSFVSANGGYDNRALIWWEETKEIKINFSQGVFSKTQLALMTNTKLVKNEGRQLISIQKIEKLETNASGRVVLSSIPHKPIFVYDVETGKKIKDWTCINDVIDIGQQYKEIIVDYYFDYDNGCEILQLGQPLTRGTFLLEGKTRVKDEVTGKVTTGIIRIPKLRLMSDLSIRLGSDAIPLVGKLDAVALPEGVRGNKKVMEIIFLSDDIDADM